MLPIVHATEKRMQNIVAKYPTIPEDKLLHRALCQLAREALLVQSSDSPFLITTWQARDYATERFRKHQENFEQLAEMIENNTINEGYLSSLESVDNPFTDIDYRAFMPISAGNIPQQQPELQPIYQQ